MGSSKDNEYFLTHIFLWLSTFGNSYLSGHNNRIFGRSVQSQKVDFPVPCRGYFRLVQSLRGWYRQVFTLPCWQQTSKVLEIFFIRYLKSVPFMSFYLFWISLMELINFQNRGKSCFADIWESLRESQKYWPQEC